MNNFLERWRDGGKASPEKQRMMDALARLGEGTKQRPSPAPVEPRKAGRLLMALDLTASRGPSLHQARIATAAMLDTIKAIGAVEVKLVYFRGTDECRASGWERPDILSKSMRQLSCELGGTQIARVLRLALKEKELSGVIYIGDHCEDDGHELRELAAALGRRSMPVFVFHECADDDEGSREAKPVFKRMAEASGGVYLKFKPNSGAVLKELFANLGAFAAAGAEGVRQAEPAKTPEARQLQTRLLLAAPERSDFRGTGGTK